MSTLSRCLLTLALALGAMLAACDGGGGTDKPSPGPAATATATAEPTAAPSPTAGPTGAPSPTAEPQETPHAAAPAVPGNVTLLDIGKMTLNLDAGETYEFDPLQVAQDQGVEPPPCAAFVFLFAWQVRDPYPPEGLNIRIRWTRMGHTETIAEEPSGETSVGCGGIEVVNDEAVKITVEMRYGFGEVQG
jgi:hypothetical protein